MRGTGTAVVFWLVLLSELAAVWLIFVLWRSKDLLFFKIVLSVLALVPFIGPLVVFWIRVLPSVKPRILQDQKWKRADFYDRWRFVIEERNPLRRYRMWRDLMTTHRNEDP